MKNDEITINSFRAWVRAARPKTLVAAAVPVLIATSLAWKTDSQAFRVLPMFLCFLFAFVMQMDANFINDYFDCKRGNDDETRLGPKRACAEGWVSQRAMMLAIGIMTILSGVVGFPLVLYGGVEMVAVGAACILFCFLYTTALSYVAMGDILVLLFFGVVPVCCTYYVELSGTTNPLTNHTFWMSLACGLIIDTLLIINNYRDYENDRNAGKNTLAVVIGRKAMSLVYLAVVPSALFIGLCCLSFSVSSVVVSIIILPFHITTWRRMVVIGEGRELNNILGKTSRNILLYGILTSMAIILS